MFSTIKRFYPYVFRQKNVPIFVFSDEGTFFINNNSFYAIYFIFFELILA